VLSRNLIRTLVIVLVPGLAACGRDPRASTDTTFEGHESVSIFDREPYVVMPIVSPGRVTGKVRLTGDVPADTVVHPTSDTDICGTEFIDTTLVRSGDGLGSVVVWLDDVKSGKPLPYIRRHDIANDGCRLTPRIQAIVAGGTLNVRSLDRVVHRKRRGTGRSGRRRPQGARTARGSLRPASVDSRLDRDLLAPLFHGDEA
jgi:hypothetical protein